MTQSPPVTTMISGQIDLIEEVIASFPQKGRILDIGTGSGEAARRFHEAGWEVTATGFNMEAYLDHSSLPEGMRVIPDVDVCDAHQFEDGEFDAIWCAHVLEHVSNTGLALEELRRLLKPNGWLFVAVPPYKEQVVGGHVNSGWNLGSLIYVLADAGFALAEGRFIHYGYNIFGMAQRGPGKLPDGALRRANGDIEALAEAGRFPKGFNPGQGFWGRKHAVNWRWNRAPQQVPAPRKELAHPPEIAPMKIGFFVPWITMGKGGTENVGQMMANAMVARGHEVTIFTFDDKSAPSRWPLDDRIALVHLPEATDVPADQRMAIEVASRNLDLLVGLHMNRTMLRYVRCAHKVGLPLILSEHIDPRFPSWMGTFSPDEREVAMAGATLIHLLLDDFVDTLDPSIRGKARVIQNTVPEPATLADHGAVKERRTLLAVSRLVPRKNQAVTVEAFARLAKDFPDWQLQIVGDGQLRSRLETLVTTLEIQDQVQFAGEHDDVYPFYAAADLFVIPSLFEGFPLTLCEAMAHGLPSVGLALCSGVREQIRDGESGILCENDDVATLEAALRQLMSDQDARARMGLAARQTFLDRFSNDVIHSAWEELFDEARHMRHVRKAPDHATLMAVRLWEQVWGPITKNNAI
ncbi:glycosyltransferase [Paracoccus litorisediminis]|uniref:Glycosyltransferase n=1 Tax=Paracoccus litorisediminis TaxID=2006130 RepID=A0A844HQ94_9RHOB|nr:glycosyltransferase [Paracoccus litorisediminis]MTH62060.1 glycosyltransferase [Paracoccus litorisediminis]